MRSTETESVIEDVPNPISRQDRCVRFYPVLLHVMSNEKVVSGRGGSPLFDELREDGGNHADGRRVAWK
jgi:hypothetical protein